ncbi:MAG: hypothetical protein WBN16_06610 [Lutimonas sp.]
MMYSNYFKGIINEGNVLSLSPKCITAMMNIIHLEGKLAGMNALRDKYDKFNFSREIFEVERRLTDLTGNIPPRQLLERFYHLTQNEK